MLRYFVRVHCAWTLEGENEASFSPNFKPSMHGNELSKAADGKWPVNSLAAIYYRLASFFYLVL